MRKTVKIRGKEISVKFVAFLLTAFLVGVVFGFSLQNVINFNFTIGETGGVTLEPSVFNVELGTLLAGSTGSGSVDASTMPKLYTDGSVNLTLIGDLECFSQFTATIHFFEWGTGTPKGSTTVSLTTPSVIYNPGSGEFTMSMDYQYQVSDSVVGGYSGTISIQFT